MGRLWAGYGQIMGKLWGRNGQGIGYMVKGFDAGLSLVDDVFVVNFRIAQLMVYMGR